MTGTSDQSCWLAEACKKFCLLLHERHVGTEPGGKVPGTDRAQAGSSTVTEERRARAAAVCHAARHTLLRHC